MEIQLKELIDQIKQDGAMAAEAEAKAILDAAKAQAESLLADAKAKADKLMADAKAENERMVRSSEDAIRQAGRNLLISFRESVTRELRAVVGEAVAKAESAEALSSLILRVVEAWASRPEVEELTVILNEKDAAAVESAAFSALKARLEGEVVLKASDDFDGGFRIAINGDGAYYDYSAEAVTDMLAQYLSPKVAALLKEAK
ncbi:MAG: V-type ATP synthase subunit E [Clostridia bacterium]|nr:V-type ATP synthase subunit E [Clostridia bacterium]